MASEEGATVAPGEEGDAGKHLESMCTWFLASICQAKEHIEHLEMIFSRNLYPALQQEKQAMIQLYEAEIADLRRHREESALKWDFLVNQRDAADREKTALEEAVAKLKEDNRNLEAKLRSLKRKRDDLVDDLEAKRVAFRSLHTRFNSLKMQHDSMIRQQVVASGIESIEGRSKENRPPPLAGSKENRPSPSKENETMVDLRTASVEISREKVSTEPMARVEPCIDAKEKATTGKIQVFKEKREVMPVVAGRPSKSPRQKGTLRDFFTTTTAKKSSEQWRSTRAENDGGRDPHDDFLNTPQELAIKKITEEKTGVAVVAETVNFVPDTLGIEWENHILQPGAVNDNSLTVDDGTHWIEDEKGAVVFDDRPGSRPNGDSSEASKANGANEETIKAPVNVASEEQAAAPDDVRSVAHKGANVASGKNSIIAERNAPGNDWIAPAKQSAQVPQYKFNEPVRKKADREVLRGVECKQCKKFYDAVEFHGEGRSRCEHHNQVSRHRYKYVPASTPEGFWNIGFSES